ncbi:amino acid adenylation domain-containing protein [Chromohalobacter marismortui]|uniref:Amino acid adenylation domain-containing protein n=1 Tax=Chromohalobacter marismortui TaxID=42055 RepID=A0A4R7NT03_9GAMM|nr:MULTISPECIES: non-ribosomal peptide synthetase [Chromohalobacter]MCI0592383.1 amino acid adenylation domain-containing protein [Chromohalobacter sp.]TDU23560.1 amino acid adenylation domain-containing protein [Chromohalobacter marismortui]
MNAGHIPTPRTDHPRDFIEHLGRLARERPADRALVVVNAQGEITLDYATLERRSRALAAELQERFAPGERALILLDNDQRYVVAFFACLHAGVIAVPVFPPESSKQQHLARLRAIAADSRAACVLTSTTIIEVVASASEGFGSAELIPVDGVDESRAECWAEHRPHEDDIAFLQYTSGSTAAPKGVMVSHGNLMANEVAIETGFSIGADDVFVSWLPLYHDMGLIGGLLQPLHRGIPVVLMSPTFFLQRPVRWLEAISRHRGTVSGGPDFAYRLCLERIRDDQLAALDLSSWRLAFSGAEPVRHSTLTGFIERFRPAGFAAETAAPCYGLAEATLLVSCNPRGTGVVGTAFSRQSLAEGKAASAVEGNTLVGCGTPAPDHGIDIVDPQEFHSLPEGEVGEIWVKGPSVAQGYWHNPEATAKTFVTRGGVSWQRTGAHDSDAHDTQAEDHNAPDDRWLRTGDLGFLNDGQLYIAGRIKDLIILRGHNVYPQDIECAIEAEVEAVRKGRIAAFAVTTPDGAEGIGVAAEVSRGMQKLVPAEKLIDALSEAVGNACHEPLSVALLLNPGGLPKTSSGKLQRSACRQGWQAGTLDAYAVHEFGRFAGEGESPQVAEAPETSTEQALAMLWRQVLGHDDSRALGRQANFFASGGDSLAAVRLASRISDHWAVDLSASSVFQHAALDDMAEAVDRLRDEHVTSRRSPIPLLPPERRVKPLPLSHAQQRLWFLWQLNPQSTAYHIGGVLRLAGQLDIAALQAAFDDLVVRHESLRTLFHLDNEGLPRQSVMPPEHLGLDVLDLRGLTAEEQRQHEDDTVRRFNDEPFHLSEGPLLRAVLLRLSDDAHVLAVVMHHIVSDGMSMQIMFDELAALYRAHKRREPAGLSFLSVQYVDYAAWHRDWLASCEGERQLAYWKQQLGSEHPTLNLPTDHPRQRAFAKRAGQHEFVLSEDLQKGLFRLAERQNTSLVTVLLATFQALLFRCSGQSDIRVGVPVANRQRREIEGVIGLFVNTLVMRNVIRSHHSLRRILTQCRDTMIDALAHSDLPFEQLVEALQPARSSTHNPLVQVAFNYRHEDMRAFQDVSELMPSDSSFLQQDAQFDLVLDVREFPGRKLAFSMIYASELFEPTTIERLSGHFQALLERMLATPGQSLGDMEVLGEAERQQLARWGGHASRYSHVDAIHRQIERQAAMTPEAIAVVCGAERLDFADLDARANRLAHWLRRHGVGPDVPVGVGMVRSVDLIVALYGVLKAGGAYVPLDPDYPAERLRYMQADAGIRLLLSHGAAIERLPRSEGVEATDLDRLDLSLEAASPPRISIHSQQLAYLIYTSGSTGIPKGVAVEHGALAMHCQSIADRYELTENDRELHFLSISFDGAHERWLSPLSRGARVVLRDQALWSVQQTYDCLTDEGITVAAFPPSYLRQLAEWAGHQQRAPGVTTYCFAGEVFDREMLRDAVAALQPRWIINGYGPTEAVVTPALWRAAAEEADFASTYAPIGEPVGDRQGHVLDADLNRVPPGMAGELYLEGGLARGYLGRPGVTAERFVPHPFMNGARLYRTGDRVRVNESGQLEYLGRLDQQVKLRGFRIELGEVEAALQQCNGVREAVVRLVETDAGRQLVGYVVGDRVAASVVKSNLADTLPDYMIPAHVMALDEMPRLPNGKVDRQALPVPELLGNDNHEAPQGEVEETLAAIWSEVLGVERVGRYDDFFELGGHSLAAIQISARFAQRLGKDLSVRLIFEYPTLAHVAEQVTPRDANDDESRTQRLSAMNQLLNELEG